MGSVDPLSWIGVGTDVLGMGASYAGNQYAADRQYQATKETNDQNYKIWQESQDFSREQADTQWEREKEMFYMENSYNNPANVVQRLREAGLNPALAMQGSLGSAMSSAASGGSPTIGGTPTAPTMQVPAIGQYYSNIANGITDASLKASQILKNVAEAKNIGVDTSYLERSMEYRIKKDMQDARYQELFTDLYQEFEPKRVAKELAKLDKENRKLDNECNRLIKEGKYLDAQRRLQDLLGDKQVFENNYLSSYYHEKLQYVKEFVTAEKEGAEADVKIKQETAKAIPKQAEAQLLGAQAGMLSAQASDYLAHNPNDLSSVLAKVIEGYTGNPDEFGRQLKEKGIISVFSKMSSEEIDRFCGDFAEKFDIPRSTVKRGFQLANPIGSLIELLSNHSDAQNAVLNWQRQKGAQQPKRR